MAGSDRSPAVPDPGSLPQPKPRTAAGCLLTAVSMVAGVVVVLSMQFLIREGGAIGGAIGGGIGALLLGGISAGVQRGRRLRARSAAAAIADDQRPPVLYLRPFGADGGQFAGMYFAFRSYEEYLAQALRGVGPVVAVGSPTDDVRAPELGAARMFLRDEEWQGRVDGLIRQASLVVLHAGASPGLRWELRRVIGAGAPERLIVCLPVDSARTPRKQRGADLRYAQFRASTADLFPRPLPASRDGAAFCCFDPDWTPRLVGLRAAPPAGGSPRDVALRALRTRFKRRVAAEPRRRAARGAA